MTSLFIYRIVRYFSVLFIVWLSASQLSLQAQTYSFDLKSSPDSAHVSWGGKEIGITPFKAKIDWSTVPDSGCILVFSKEGYDNFELEIAEKPKYKENYRTVQMKRKMPHYDDLDSNSVLVDFDKFMTEMELGKQIGNNKTFYGGPIYWQAYSRVGKEAFVYKAHDMLGSAGFRTPTIKKNELFSTESTDNLEARYIVGGKLTDIWVELGPTTLIGIMAKNWCTIEWQVFDKYSNQVVLKQETRGEIEGKYKKVTELNVMMDLFYDAFRNFLLSGQLHDLVINSSRPSATTNGFASTDERLALAPVQMPIFQSSPEMIQYATQACATLRAGNHFCSGVMISNTGHFITNATVAKSSSALSIVLSNGVELEAQLLRADEQADVALLKVSGSKFKALSIGEGTSTPLGSELVAIGTPKSIELGQAVAKGILNGKDQQNGLVLLQTDISVRLGNAGGPVLDNKGNIIGIIYGRNLSPNAEGKALALPIEVAMKRLGM